MNLFDQKSNYEKLNKRLSKYLLSLQEIYDVANLEASKIAIATGYIGSDGVPFSFKSYPATTERVKKMLSTYVNDMEILVHSGTSAEWKQSNLAQDLLADGVLGKRKKQVKGAKRDQYYKKNNDALKAFQQRKDKGMNLSDKIWINATDYRRELESAISCGIEKGMSATVLSKRVSKYLKDFPSLQKDYGERFGKADNIYDCEYRSMRLVRSEINMAYRTAEQTRWQQMDFIVGYEIKLSKVHHHRMPHGDICDDLVGKYPKTFKWTGWHPNDLCYVVPILKAEEELWDVEDDIPSKNEVTDVPAGFKEWVRNNKERIKKAEQKGTLPYFVRDNKHVVDIIHKNYIQDIAKIRHSNRDEDAIRHAWTNRKILRDEYFGSAIARVRKGANSIGFDISELNHFLSTEKFKVDKYGMLSESDWNKVNNLINAHSELIRTHNKIKTLLNPYSDYPEFVAQKTRELKQIKIHSKSEFNKILNDFKNNIDKSFQEFASRNYTEKFTVHDQASYERVMDMMGRATKPVWEKTPYDSRHAFVDYTGTESGKILSDLGLGIHNEKAQKMSAVLDGIKTTEDLVLRSGQNTDVLGYIWGDDFKKAFETGDIDMLNAKYGNSIGVNKAFMSTSFSEKGGMEGSYELHIFAPKGTHCINLKEISYFGNQISVTNWDGQSYSKDFDQFEECEFLLAEGYRYKFLKAVAREGKGGGIRLYVQLLNRVK